VSDGGGSSHGQPHTASSGVAATGVLGALREACAEVARRARSVRIDDGPLEAFSAHLTNTRPRAPGVDPTHHRLGDARSTLAFALTMNAVNFGSGWFPHLVKRPGLSGYLTLASALRERFESNGPWTAGELRTLTAADCAAVFGQPAEGPAGELMAHYARALAELGDFLLSGYDGRFAGPVEEAGGSAERLVAILARMSLYRDVSSYQELELPFYKRAQITCADLAEALSGRGLGRFDDLDRLTLFADNLVPHVLRMLDILRYDFLLEQRIDREELIESGSEEEVEIRAVALHAVERMAASCARRGWTVTPHRLDSLLWARGQHPKIKARPRHRTRCTFY
jgi:hypothetical protein